MKSKAKDVMLVARCFFKDLQGACNNKLLGEYLLKITFSKLIQFHLRLKNILNLSENSRIWIHPRTYLLFRKNAKLIVDGGYFQFGYSLPNITYFPGHSKSALYLAKDAKLKVQGDIAFGNGCVLKIGPNASCIIGKDSIFSQNSIIFVKEALQIGNECMVGWNTQIMDFDGHPIGYDNQPPQLKVEPVTIGNHVWIGANVKINKGVTIGDGAMIGSHSVVTHNVPPNSMVAGVPARVIKEKIEWQR